MAFNNFNNPRQMFPTQNQGNFNGMQASGQPIGGLQPNQPHGVQQSQGFPGYQMGSHMGPQMNSQMRPHMGSPMEPHMGQQMGPQVNLHIGPQMNPQMGPQMNPQMGAQMNSQMRPHMGPYIGPQIQPQIGPQMNPQIRPQMNQHTGPQMNPQMGLQIGAFPSNVQLGHQFPKQQQKIIDQQRKQAEEQLKKQQELMKKKQLEAEKRKLQQSFSAKKPSNANALNNLFGKNKKESNSLMTDLIGSLGSKTTAKRSSSKASSVFSRIGGSEANQSNLTPGQWGSGYMTSGQMTPQGSPASTMSQVPDMDEFGDFSQGPSLADQAGFSDFQKPEPSTQFGVTGGSFSIMGSSASVHPNVSGSTSVFSQTQAWHSTPSLPAATPGTQNSFPVSQNISAASSIHGEQITQHHMTNAGAPQAVSWVGPSSVTQGGHMTQFSGQPTPQTGGILGGRSQGGQMTHFMGETSKNRAGSIPEMMSNVGSNAPSGGAMPQPGVPHSPVIRSQGGGNFPMSVPPSTIGPQGSSFGTGPIQPGGMPVPIKEEPNMQQGSVMGSMPPTEPLHESVPEVEESPERKLELLYGVSLPEWCVHATDLPGVYKEIAEKTSDGSDGIDTSRLFPILVASDLPRDQLGQIWNRANRAVPGQLNELELRIVLGLVALAQAGMKTERLTLEKLSSCKAAPIPTIPESALQTKGRGWSFTEPSQEGPQSSGMIEGSTSHIRYSSTSSDHSIDPNDKYSVFRAVDNPETTSIASSSSVDSRDDFAAFRSADQPIMMKAGSQPSEVPLFQGGISEPSSNWNRLETSSMGGSKLPNQQDFGNFQCVLGQRTNEQNAFGDFQGQTGFNNQFNLSGPSNLNEDNFGDFQSEAFLHGSQTKVPDFGNFQGGGDLGGVNSSALTPLGIPKTKPQEDDFGDFQGEKEPEAGNLASIQPPPKQQDKSLFLPGFGDFKIGGEPGNMSKSSVAGVDLVSNTISHTATKSVVNTDSSKNLAKASDFGDFQHSPGPLSTGNKKFTSFSSGDSDKLVSSLEKFKLSSQVLSSAQGGVNSTHTSENESLIKGLANELPPTDSKKQNMFAEFPVLGNNPSPTPNKVKTHEDRYSALKDADFGSRGGIFSVQEPATTDNQIADDGFADFGGFEVADQVKSGEDSDFGAFKSTENVQSVSFGVAGDSKPALQNFDQDFGDFKSSGNTNTSNAQPAKASSAGFRAFGSFVAGSSSASSSQPHSSSNANDSLINSVSLEPTERYKVLSHDSGDMDQHTHAWSRCLNSCLLTLAAATLAIQKIAEQSVKEEVLESKEGATYFSAIVEIYRVTLRIKASINKSAPNNTKLKDIYQEIERTWKDISNFLSGSDILPSRSSLDFTLHHVSATEDGSVACGICLLNVNKTTIGSSKQGDGKLMYGGRQYHSTCANFWCNRVDSVLPSLLPIDSLI